MKKKGIIILLVAAGISFLFLPEVAAATTKTYLGSRIIPPECIGEQFNNECQLPQVEEMLVNIAKLILGLAGSLSLLVFVYGGILYITSGGESAKVSKAHSVLKNGIVGIALVLGAGAVVKLFLQIFGL